MKTNPNDAALVLVDIQNDFCPGGALAVPEGDAVVPVVNKLIARFGLVAATQDWHPANHISFNARGGPWPPHCLQDTRGAELHPDLDKDKIDLVFKKGFSPDLEAYSAFDGVDETGASLDEALKNRGIKRLFIAGLATDYCVLATVIDGVRAGYEVNAIEDAMRAVNVRPEDGEKALEEMKRTGARVIRSNQALRSVDSAAASR